MQDVKQIPPPRSSRQVCLLVFFLCSTKSGTVESDFVSGSLVQCSVVVVNCGLLSITHCLSTVCASLW